MIEGTYPSTPGPFDLYDFITNANRQLLIERGILPWWSHPQMELRFVRPLSSALLWADHRLFGSRVLFAHLHSFLWWGLACWALFALLRELFSHRVAVLGAFMYAVAPCHGFPLAWMANREALVSAALGTLALTHHARWRASLVAERRWREGLWALALFSIAMLAGEYTLCFGGYVLAMELVRPREPWTRRALGVSSFAAPALAYMVVRHTLHYGAFGTGYYHDPLRDFSGYAEAFPLRLGLLLSIAWAVVDDRTWVNLPGWAVAILFALTAALVRVPLSRALRALDPAHRARARWLLLGSVLSIAPIIAVGSSARLLEIPMVGVAAGLALILDRAWFPAPGESRRVEWAELMALVLAFLHLVRAPLDSWLAHRYLRGVAENFDKQMNWLHDKAEGKEMVVVIRASLFQTLFVTPLRVDGAIPCRDLTFGSGRMLLLRPTDRSLELVATSQPLFPVGPDDLVRNSDAPLHVGDTVELTGMTAKVLALREDGTPRRLSFEFDRDLDDPSFLWVAENANGFTEVKLPPPGHGEPLKM
jgi:hypothetical protein